MFQVQVLGTGASIPTNTRLPSAQIVTINDRHHLVDCGEGTQMQLLRHKIRFSRLDSIFITHLHGDHMLGVPGLLSTLSLYERNYPLKLFAPAGMMDILNVVFAKSMSRLNFELEFYPTEEYKPGDIIFETDKFQVKALPLEHRIYCCGFRFTEINKRPRFDFYKAKALDIPNAYYPLLKLGNSVTLDDGRLISPDMVLREAENPLSFSYCSDTRYNEALIEHIYGSHLLYHEATFQFDMLDRAEETWHSTAWQAAQIACRGQVRRLLLGHFSARYRELEPLLDEARSIFPHTQLAKEGFVYDLKEFA